MTDVVGNPEEERRAEFYFQPWAQEAVCRYFYSKVSSPNPRELPYQTRGREGGREALVSVPPCSVGALQSCWLGPPSSCPVALASQLKEAFPGSSCFDISSWDIQSGNHSTDGAFLLPNHTHVKCCACWILETALPFPGAFLI